MKLFDREIAITSSVESLSPEATREQGSRGRFADLQELLPLLCDPVSKAPLVLRDSALVGSGRTYPLSHGNPLLFPIDIEALYARIRGPDFLSVFPSLSPTEQYCVFGLLKASGNNNNLDYADVWYGRHLHRASKLLADARGTFLDIGCDDVFLSRGMLDPSVLYVGLEPSAGPSRALRVGGMGEFLPFGPDSFDGVSFQTSLDHVFDYHLALSEARRVLRTGGRLYLATLLWLDGGQLFTDTVHFHHFRPKQIEAALEDFEIETLDCYNWKNNTHRFGVYLSAIKR
ncbi:MAG: methyltransferase domain-containing protein [Burkholderiaceae bacterium]